MKKFCKECGEDKDISAFQVVRPKKSGGFTYATRCMKCVNRLKEEKLRQDPLRLAARAANRKAWEEKNADKLKEYHRSKSKERWAEKKKKGFTAEERAAQREAQRLYKESGKRKAWEENNADKLKESWSKQAKRRWQVEKAEKDESRRLRVLAAQKKRRENGERQKWEKEKMQTDPEFAKARRDISRRNIIRRRSVTGTHTIEQWEALKAEYDHTCLRCGRREPEVTLSRDHVLPIAKGGTDNIDNIQPLCRKCNSQKHVQFVDYRHPAPGNTVTVAPTQR